MKKRKIKKKVSKTRNAKINPTTQFMEQSSKEVAALGGLALTPQEPLESQGDFRLIARDE